MKTFPFIGIGKHVSVQSPSGLNQDETLRMVQAAQYYPRLISTLNTGLRFLPAFVKMRNFIRSGFLGPAGASLIDVRLSTGPLIGRSYSWLCDDAMGGGVLNLFGAHIVDLLTFLTGRKVARAHGVVRTFVKTTPTIHGIRQIKSDDLATFQLEMEGGVFATVNLNAQLNGFRQEVNVCGHEGYLVARNGDLFGKKNDSVSEAPLLIDEVNPKEEDALLPAIYVSGLSEMYSQLAGAFRSRAASPEDDSASRSRDKNNAAAPYSQFATFEDGQYVQAVIEAIRHSSREKCWSKVIERRKEDEHDLALVDDPTSYPMNPSSSAGASAVAIFSHRRRMSLFPS